MLSVTGVRANLIEKEISAGGDRMTLQLKPVQAMHARDALVKQLDARIFDHLVHCINHALATEKECAAMVVKSGCQCDARAEPHAAAFCLGLHQL